MACGGHCRGLWMSILSEIPSAGNADAVIPAKAGIHAYRDAGALINNGAARIFRRMI